MSKFKSNDEFFTYSKTLAVIPTEDVVQLLGNFNIKIESYVHRFLLRETMVSKIFQTKRYAGYTDELKYRLRGYQEYSIYQIEKMIEEYNLDFDAAKYKEMLFDLLYLNKDLYHLKPSFFDELEKLKYKYQVDFEKIRYSDFLKMMSHLFYEPKGYLDGVSLKVLKESLVHSCTLGGLRGLGEKYGVSVPRRINKQKLLDILTARFRLSDDENKLLSDKSVLELEIYAKEKGFQISIDLKKSDMVEYIIFSLQMYHTEIAKDEHSYDIPLLSDIDSVKVDTIEFEKTDQTLPVMDKSETKPIESVLEEEDIEVPPVVVVKQEPILKAKPVVKAEEVAPVKKEEVLPPTEKEELPVEVEKAEEPKKASEEKPFAKKEPKPAFIAPKDESASSSAIISSSLPEYSAEEKDLLDEKIHQIIKKYHKRKNKRRVLLTLLFVVLFAVFALVGYSYLYYTQLNPGELPFGIPVFW